MNQKGFTLIELLVVMSIMAILASISQPTFARSRIRAKETSLQHTLFVLRDVIDQYYADHGEYPDCLDSLVEKKYIRAVPKDPFTGSAFTWILIPSEGEKEIGIFDIHSGAYKISLKGVPYNEW